MSEGVLFQIGNLKFDLKLVLIYAGVSVVVNAAVKL